MIFFHTKRTEEEKLAVVQKARDAEDLVNRLVEEAEMRRKESEDLKRDVLAARYILNVVPQPGYAQETDTSYSILKPLSVGPKQLCASTQLECACKVGTS